ncbi:hypothetical protein [Falsiroseomonas oryzae]|uniref:hypothetical protein n=1 Tax=Falsiroseomonas oryzae TaxID=2766473 RepID=UPI0022EB1FED|nr:hypothetical protein [Roseomonas sp. MO-31]
MSIQEDLRTILRTKGARIIFGSRAGAPIHPTDGGLEELGFIKPNRRMAQIMLWPARSPPEIEIRYAADDDAAANGIVVDWVEQKATYGILTRLPGFVFTARLGACRSYLLRDHRDHPGCIIGAHGHQGTQGGALLICDPVDYFLSRGSKEIWEFHSKGLFGKPVANKTTFGATLCYVDAATAYCFAFAYIERTHGLQVVELVKHGKKDLAEIADWRRASVAE